jgi:hypothetical protein
VWKAWVLNHAITCNLKLPVAVAHVGYVTVPAVGADGVGCALTTISDDMPMYILLRGLLI